MPLIEKPQQVGFTARLMELSSTDAPWHRRLWRGSTMQLGRELLDESIRPGIPESALTDQRHYLQHALQTDDGISDRGNCVRSILRQFTPGITTSDHAWIQVSEHISRLNESYLATWADAFEPKSGRAPVDVEGAARRIVSHLLDSGMHVRSIYSWVRALQKDSTEVSIAEFLREAHKRLHRPERSYQFCVPIASRLNFDPSDYSSSGWLTPQQTARWREDHAPNAPAVRQFGSFIISTTARDVNAAADRARVAASNLVGKFEIGAHKPLEIAAQMWSKQKHTEFPTQATNRLIKILAFERLDKLHELDMPDHIANMIALVQPLRTSAPHIAVISAWSAMESLLVGPNDPSDVVAAERFSRIIAASMLRAEFTWLAKSYTASMGDALGQEMQACETNLERAKLMQMRACTSTPITLNQVTDQLALSRVEASLANPKREMEKITAILNREFVRLYRKRNMIVHGGHVHESSLHSISEMLSPLIGAGVDRITHVALKFGIPPIQLSATTEARLSYLIPSDESQAGNLLDLLEAATP